MKLWYFDTIRPFLLKQKFATQAAGAGDISKLVELHIPQGLGPPGTLQPAPLSCLSYICISTRMCLNSPRCFSNPHISAIKPPQHLGKKKLKVKTLNKTPEVLCPKRGCSLDFRKASPLLCSGGIWTIAGLKLDSSLQASKFGGGPRMLTKEGSDHQLLFNYRSACSPSQILQTFRKETGDIWTCTLQRTVWDSCRKK